jgi:hypothetical protein
VGEVSSLTPDTFCASICVSAGVSRTQRRPRCRQGWTLLPKLKLQVKGKNIFPDDTLRDFFNLRRGFWEAKDTRDGLNVEISKRIEKGHPLNYAIFEETRTTVLFQNG